MNKNYLIKINNKINSKPVFGLIKNFKNLLLFNFKNILLLLVLLLFSTNVFALTSTHALNGNEFSSISGSYLTKNHCAGSCSWLAGEQIILGTYNGAFDGGSASWTFSVPEVDGVNLIQGGQLKITWPTVYGKGLHSVGVVSTSVAKVNSTIVGSPQTTTAISCGTGDNYSFACANYSVAYSIPAGAISSSTVVTISVPSKTLWDISKVELIVDYANNSVCSKNSDCGVDDWVLDSSSSCVGNKVHQNFRKFTCNNPGTINASCSFVVEQKLKETCSNNCSNGKCVSNSNEISIENGKVYVGGEEFLIKGVAYAPWLRTTGPDSTVWQKPFPNRMDDVTDLLMVDNKLSVVDYSGDGRIQAWEVIRFDVEVMKKIGANTIRTYASGSWHDKDLDGVITISKNNKLNEVIQGDFTDWMIDELLTQASVNDMKVIIGYWVQEENFKGEPPIANWDDLLVAKQAWGRVVNKYKNNSTVLGWGIGNEVNGIFNQGWFSWGVPVNDYLNALFDYTRTLDSTHPIIYAKYIGENTNFNNLSADIIAINAFTFSADDLIRLNEFIILAPQGKAYMLGEFGHVIDQTQGQWNLSKTYAGGAFLEYNNVWWKGAGQNLMGLVDEYRTRIDERFFVLYNLYGGSPACSKTSDCGTEFFGENRCNGSNVVRTHLSPACNNPSTSNSFCRITQSEDIVQTCEYGCSDNACLPAPACYINSECGVDSFDDETEYCSGNNIMKRFSQRICFLAGTPHSFCGVNQDFKIFKTCEHGCLNGVCLGEPVCYKNTDCGVDSYSGNFCNGDNVVRTLTQNVCTNPGDARYSFCNAVQKEELVQLCSNGCSNGTCLGSIVCSKNSDCGGDSYSNNFCSGGNVVRTLTQNICNNPSSVNSSCSVIQSEGLVKSCQNGCENAECIGSFCSTNSQCGANGVVDSICVGKKLYDVKRTFKCNSPGKVNSFCSSTDAQVLKQTCTYGCENGACLPKPVCSKNTDCGKDSYSNNFCSGGNIVRTLTQNICNNPGSVNSSCSVVQKEEVVQSCQDGCENGVCVGSFCSSNSQCGKNGVVDSICVGNKLYNIKRTFKCNFPKKVNSFCSSKDTRVLKQTCKYGCVNGACLPKPVCSKNTDCGKDSVSAKTCSEGNVVTFSTKYTCNNSGTQESTCDKTITPTIIQTCQNGCEKGKCLPAPCGFNDGVLVSFETNSNTAWDIDKIELIVSVKVGKSTKNFTFTKFGNEIDSGEGAYSISTHCGSACQWLIGEQVIVGAYNSDPAQWGGKVNYKFDLGTEINSSSITKLSLKVYEPKNSTKGLHSPLKTGQGVIKIQGIPIKTLSTNKVKCGVDWFSSSCSTYKFTYTVTTSKLGCIPS